MKNHILLCALIAAVFFSGRAYCAQAKPRGLFVSAIEEPFALSSRREIAQLVDFAGKAGITEIFIQIYRANQAWFLSKTADSSPYRDCLNKVGEDPLALLIKEAHARGIRVHAWLNMLSLSRNKKAPFLAKYGAGILTRNLKEKNKLEDYKIDDQYFLEPGDPRVRAELLNIVEEILFAYPDLDGLQFDYIRYPDRNPAYGFAGKNVERFKKATGFKVIEEKNPAWLDWKRSQVTDLLESLVKKARGMRRDIRVSATGCIPYQRAYYEAFQDWPDWVNRGLVDFVTLMDYSPELSEYERWLTAAQSKANDLSKVNIGVGAYKLVNSPVTFADELNICEKHCAAKCVIFYYGSLRQNPELGRVLREEVNGKNSDSGPLKLSRSCAGGL